MPLLPKSYEERGFLHKLLFCQYATRCFDEVGQIHDRAIAASVPISTQIGRHANDMMLSFYMNSPFGFDIEIGCEGLLVGEDWVPQKLIRPDIWGFLPL